MKDKGGPTPRKRKPRAAAAATGSTPPAAGYAQAVNTGVQATVQTVQDMHHAIADKTFDGLHRVPGLSVPTRIVQGVHDAITQGVYAAVRHGSGAVMSVAGVAERLATDASRSPQGRERAVRSALNGVFGDALADAGSSLSISMGFHAHRAPLPLSHDALAGLRARVCVFIHGLACDEHSWWRASPAWIDTPWAQALKPGEAIHYGALLEAGADISSIYLRYNTGLAVAKNARQLAEQLEQLVRAAPAHLRELVLIGHSMGGLVARSACDVAAVRGLSWLGRVRLLICLGTPHQGALLEQLGHLSSLALGVAKTTRPLARVANARSQGIKDLRHGLGKASRGVGAPAAPLALRFIAASLGDESDSAIVSMLGKAFGDGLVFPSSATDDGLVGDVQRVELAGLGHMALLNHPRVYAHLRDWLAETGPAGSAAGA